MNSSRRLRMKGAALVEFSISVPLLILVFLAATFCYEMVQVKLKLQEASRFAAWEMTSFLLNDFGSSRHASAFAGASRRVQSDAERQFAGLHSVDRDETTGFTTSFSPIRINIRNGTIDETDGQRGNYSPDGHNPLVDSLSRALNQPINSILDRWGFDRAGKVTAQASLTLRPGIMAVPWLNRSSGIDLKSEFTLIASAWNLGDGADAMMRAKRAGNHKTGSWPHGLYSQVNRMTFLGVRGALEDRSNMRELLERVGSGLPNPMGTFVVSHNFAPGNIRDCNQTANYTAKAGLNNSNGQERFPDQYTRLDLQVPRCFDTAPYQDTHFYEESLYKRVFDHRGPFFLGSVSPMTENPSSSGP